MLIAYGSSRHRWGLTRAGAWGVRAVTNGELRGSVTPRLFLGEILIARPDSLVDTSSVARRCASKFETANSAAPVRARRH